MGACLRCRQMKMPVRVHYCNWKGLWLINSSVPKRDLVKDASRQFGLVMRRRTLGC